MTRKSISVRINGKDTQIDHDLTIAQLLGQLEINIKLIAVALNGVVIRRNDLSQVQISPRNFIFLV